MRVFTVERVRSSGDKVSSSHPGRVLGGWGRVVVGGVRGKEEGWIKRAVQVWGTITLRLIITHLLKTAAWNALPGSAERKKP